MLRTFVLMMLQSFGALISSAQEATNDSTFRVTGTVSGLKNGVVYFLYNNPESGGAFDSTKVHNERFTFSGRLTEPTLAELSLTPFLSGYGLDYANIFLEPGNINIKAHKDSFRFLQATGSLSQKDNELLVKLKKRHLIEQSVINKMLEAKPPPGIMDSLIKEDAVLQTAMTALDSQFIVHHPESFVAAHLLELNLRFERIHFYPVDNLYNKLPMQIKNSSYGKRIFMAMEKVSKLPVGGNAPLFAATDISGRQISLAGFKNKNCVLLDFWASWCMPCRRLTPTVKAIYEELHKQGLEVISIATNDKEQDWRKAITEDKSSAWHHIRDSGQIATDYAIDGIPAFYLINKEGKIVARYGVAKGYGEKPFWEMYSDIKQALATPALTGLAK